MKNLFNRIFGSSKKNNETVQTFDDLNTLEPVMEVDESIFVEALDEEKEVAQQHEEISVRRKTAFDALLERDHRANGYSEGYNSQDPGRLADYKDSLIAEASELFKSELRVLDIERLQIDKFNGREDEMSLTVQNELNRTRKAWAIKREDLLDRLAAIEEGRGPIAVAIRSYQAGFDQGFLDKNSIYNIENFINL